MKCLLFVVLIIASILFATHAERSKRAINPFLDSMGKRAVNPFLDSIGKRALSGYLIPQSYLQKRYFDSLAGQSLGKRSVDLDAY